jgi:hypothetical protein
MEDDLTSGERFHHVLGAPHVTDDWLRTEMPHLRHARHPANEAYDGVIAPYERRDKRSTKRAGRSGNENSHGKLYRSMAFCVVRKITGTSFISM